MKYGIKFECRAAHLAKKLGYTHIAAVVKQVFSTSYYNINSCDSVISSGRWDGARGYNYPIGTIDSKVDWSKTITRADLHAKLRESEKED